MSVSRAYEFPCKFGLKMYSDYRAMHFSAKRSLAIACRLSVRL